MARSNASTTRPTFSSTEEEIEWYETHDSWDEDDVEVKVNVKIPLDQVIPVRLTADKWRALHREARELGVGPTTLARMWLLEKLRSVEAARPAGQRVADDKVEYSAKGEPKVARNASPAKNNAAPRKKSS